MDKNTKADDAIHTMFGGALAPKPEPTKPCKCGAVSVHRSDCEARPERHSEPTKPVGSLLGQAALAVLGTLPAVDGSLNAQALCDAQALVAHVAELEHMLAAARGIIATERTEIALFHAAVKAESLSTYRAAVNRVSK